jgi:hypothetical protein
VRMMDWLRGHARMHVRQRTVGLLRHGLLLVLLLLARAAAAQSPSIQAESTASYDFGQSMHFEVRAQITEGLDLEEAVLYLRLGDTSAVRPYKVPVTRGTTIIGSYDLDLTGNPLAPFATVTYWWQLRDEAGLVYIVPEKRMRYEDSRFAWQSLTQDEVTVHWAGEDPDSGQLALEMTLAAIDRLEAIVPPTPRRGLEVYVYPDSDDLQTALALSGQNWKEGTVPPELDVVMVAEIHGDVPVELSLALSRELNRVLLRDYFGPADERVPGWYHEGLVAVVGDLPKSAYEPILRDKAAEHRLLPVANLCGALPDDTSDYTLAQAQSASLMTFIRGHYGDAALRRLAYVVAGGDDCESIARRGLGLSLGELEQSWRLQFAPNSLETVWLRGRVWFALIALGFALMAYLAYHIPFTRDFK